MVLRPLVSETGQGVNVILDIFADGPLLLAVTRTFYEANMSSALSLIVFGQVYFLGPMSNTPSIAPNTTLTPTIYQNQSQPEPLRGVRRDDYTYVSGLGGYKLHTRATEWAKARLICQEEGGHLAIINSVAESNVISEVFQKAKPITGSIYTNDALIGFHDLYSEGQYVTINDDSLERAGYDEWSSGQPNNLNVQNCGGVAKNGRLNDLWCYKPHGFICEIPDIQDYVNFGALSSTEN